MIATPEDVTRGVRGVPLAVLGPVATETPEAVISLRAGVPDGFNIWVAVPEAVSVSVLGVPDASLANSVVTPEAVMVGTVGVPDTYWICMTVPEAVMASRLGVP